ncbi:type I polyketide synthase [Planomonospora parontospora]|uniref:type I polyketide synthase n=1 Tax=Planomonospora parontospora TaxID=58119 RepID=UPI00167081A7|nr:type I polyketide synthase [Planomonospora parontospora]GGL40595.1 polyketide synthase [Planomonospora parontospora subsp. antibiotica]GII18248.1 polyketide synthase [Planomonospora parontospora subsp. antibiotica]
MYEPIAIVGAACRYPDAGDPDELWEMVLSGRRAFRPLPPRRLNLDDYAAAGADGTYARFAAVLEGWTFDRTRFRIPGPTYRVTDPAHWLALEVAADALASAGHPDGRGLDRDRVGVVIGNSMNGEFSRASVLRLRWPYVRRVLQHALTAEGWAPEAQARFLAGLEQTYKSPFPEPNDETLAGGLANTIAGRICNHFDLHGGGYTVDGACSSSLLSVITAARALRAGDIDVAVAGGVDLSLDPFELVGFARTGALATSAMRVYDADPTGFWPGEGCGMVVLMRAEDAVAAGRRPLALIRGWGVSSDGRGGITRPERAGQLLAVQRAYEQAGFGPETVALFEGHGTGTAVGDAVEIAALAEAQRGMRTLDPAALGSVKANIGHTKAAAGVAGLLKATMALHRQVIPPTTGCEEPHELLRAHAVPLRVVRDAETWPQEAPLRAAVSAMGFGGINTHLVLESPAPRRRPAFTARERRVARHPLGHEVFVFGAASAEDLVAQLDRAACVAAALSFAEQVDLAAGLARTAAGARRPHRAAVVAADPEQLARRARQAAQLVADRRDDRLVTLPGICVGSGAPGQAGLLFTGQGTAVPAGPGALGVVLPEVEDLFDKAPSHTGTVDTAVAQPAIVKASLAGLRWLNRLGVDACGAVGHSLGEITALHWAGALSEGDTVDLVTTRGRIMGEHGAPFTGMASIIAGDEPLRRLIAGTEAVIAADHGTAHVVAGPVRDLDRILERCREQDIVAKRLSVSHGFHSPAFTAAEPRLASYLDQVTLDAPARPVYSTVSGGLLDGDADVRRLLTVQLTAPVLFRQAVSELAKSCDLLIEVGPGRALASLAGDITGVPAFALDIGATSGRQLCHAAGALYACGAVDDLRPMFAERFHREFDLWRDPTFLENPCERAPESLALPGVPVPVAPSSPAEEHGLQEDVSSAVRRVVAEAIELPVDAIGGDDRLLSDLHLNSLRVVQIVTQAAAACLRAAPVEPLVASDVSVSELIGLIEALPAVSDDAHEPAVPAGVAEWHRILGPRHEPVELTEEATDHTWRVWGRGALRAELEPLLRTDDWQPSAELVLLPEDPDDQDIAGLLDIAKAAVDKAVPLAVIEHGDTAAGYLATIRQEHPDRAVRWIGGASAGTAAAVARALRSSPDEHPELVIDENGRICTLTYAPLPLPPAQEAPLGGDDVVLVTGGGKGIGFQTALALGRSYGARIALLGRSRPQDDDELRANLSLMEELNIPHLYVTADIADTSAVRQAVARITGELGQVTAVVHSSGVNRPKRFAGLGAADYAEHAAPKYHGLRALVDALDTASLRLLITYGSVIGRFGLPGEAHYALANGRMRELARVLARDLPGCRVWNMDWTAWSGAGMGERLDVLDGLMRAGVVPLPVETGIALLRKLLAARPAEPSVVVAGRLPQLESPQPVGGHPYLRRVRTMLAGVELVAEAELDAERDPYLRDHRIDGLMVLPAVCAIEAMAQAATVLTGRPVTGLEDCRFDRPVIIPEGTARTIRICALVGDGGDVEVVIRSDETGFAVDHFSGRVPLCPPEPVDLPAGRSQLPAHRGRDLYGPTFFHGPLFQRLRGYDHLQATACTAVLAAEDRWRFGPGVRGGLQFGDPSVHDATVHVLQACVPNRRLLPVGCDAFTVQPGSRDGDLILTAVEREHTGAEYTYDVIARDHRGRSVTAWTGLRLRDVGPIEPSGGYPDVLIGPYLERSLETLLPGTPVHVAVRPKTEGRTAGRRSAHRGAPDPAIGRSHLDDLILQISGSTPLTCDWEWVTDDPGHLRAEKAWAGQAEQITKLTGEPEGHVLTRLWTARECLAKSGRAAAQSPLTIQGAYEQGWLLLRSGADHLASVVIPVGDERRPAAITVMLKGGS